MAGVIKCVSVMKDIGLRLTRMAFQYLLRAARQEPSSEGGEEVGVVSGEGESNEEGVASSDDISRLLDHIKVLVDTNHILTPAMCTCPTLRGHPSHQACVMRCVCTSWTEVSSEGYQTSSPPLSLTALCWDNF